MPEWVITGGRVVVEEGHVKVARGAGSYVVTPPFSPYVYDRVKEAEIALAKRNMPVIRTPEVFLKLILIKEALFCTSMSTFHKFYFCRNNSAELLF